MKSAWENINFKLEDLLDRIYAKVNGIQCLWVTGKTCQCYDPSTRKVIVNRCYIHLETLDTLYNGRCYVFNLTHNVSAATENMYFVFKHSRVSKGDKLDYSAGSYLHKLGDFA